MNFSKRSLDNLKGIHPDLVKVIYRAMGLSIMDFTVTDGVRTLAQQKKLYDQGRNGNPGPIVTWTMESNHLPKADGYGHAVDMAPYPIDYNNTESFTSLARLMREAALQEGIRTVWGCIWDRCLNDLSDNLHAEIEGYVYRRKALGKKASQDRPHFELWSET